MPSKSIGFRAEPAALHWATVSRGEHGLVMEQSGTIKAPKDLSEGATLSWFRGRVKTLLDEQAPEVAAIKYTEQIAPGGRGDSARRRVRTEGVILQLLDEKGLSVVTGAYRAMAGQMKTTSAKKYLAEPTLRGLDWSGLPQLRKEALLVAVAGLEG